MSVSISIKSEIDSRVMLYPLMRCLRPLGNILIVTSNKQVSRLIDGEYEGDFRNFHIMVDLEGATDELLEDADISPKDYTYVVYDNVGVTNQDKLLIPIGPIVSEQFESDMMYYGEDHDTHILRFGRALKRSTSTDAYAKRKAEEEAEARRKANKKNLTEEEVDEEVRKKFQPKKEDVATKLKKLPNIKFPSFEEMELFESDQRFGNIDSNFIKFFYAVFQDYIGIKEPNFIREVTRKDACSSSISQRPASGENSVKSPVI